MKRGIIISLRSLILRILLFAVILCSVFSFYLIPLNCTESMEKLALFSLSLAYPANSRTSSLTQPAEMTDNQNNKSKKEKTVPKTEKSADEIPKEKRREIKTETLCGTKSDLHYGNIYIRNITESKTVDIKKALEKTPDIKIKKDGSPQVLIMHTHTTECYMPADLGVYSTDWPTRSLDEKQNTVAVGRVIADKLNQAGIKTVQAADVHDDPEYSGAYDRSGETVKKYLKKYPGIQVVLDIHRDSVTNADKSKVKPTVEISGKKAAQIMIINGCEDGKIDNYPDWEVNMRFAIRLQQQLQADNPNLARPLYFTCREYNQRLTHGSLLIEMGSEANTLEEAKYSAGLLSESLITLLNSDELQEGSEKEEPAKELE